MTSTSTRVYTTISQTQTSSSQSLSLSRAQKIKMTASTVTLFLFLAVFSVTFHGCFSDSNQPPAKKRQTGPTRLGSSVVFPVKGNVYPLGYYSVYMSIGQPPKPYDLDIDTGSDLTWVQCDAPCTGCTKPRNRLYKPRNNHVPCKDPICHALSDQPCESPEDQCDYEVEYADSGSSIGVIVNDHFPLRLINGSALAPRLAFGCGYDLKFSDPNPPPTAGVLGLGNGKGSVLSQLHDMGLTKNVVGHCFSQQGGFLFFGDDLVPSSGIVWTPMSRNSMERHYISGHVEVFFGGKTTGVKGLNMIFDSGSSYTYFSSQPYQAIVNLIKKNSNGNPLKDAREDPTLPICWKGAKPFKSISEVRDYFKPIALTFTKAKNVQLQLAPEAYLILSKLGNVCLGILNGTEVGLGNMNVIGDNFMVDKMVVYDNEKQNIGWIPANCDRLPNMDRDYKDEGSSQRNAAYYPDFFEDL